MPPFSQTLRIAHATKTSLSLKMWRQRPSPALSSVEPTPGPGHLAKQLHPATGARTKAKSTSSTLTTRNPSAHVRTLSIDLQPVNASKMSTLRFSRAPSVPTVSQLLRKSHTIRWKRRLLAAFGPYHPRHTARVRSSTTISMLRSAALSLAMFKSANFWRISAYFKCT